MLIRDGNYLRARGEYIKHHCGHKHSRELPPRTRRIQTAGQFTGAVGGTTSAHAENTVMLPLCRLVPWNYLRARGEYF